MSGTIYTEFTWNDTKRVTSHNIIPKIDLDDGTKKSETIVEVSSIEDVPENPRSWPTRRRVIVCIGPILTAFTGNLTISVYVASIPGIIREFHVSTTLAIFLLSLAALGFFLAPLIAVSCSEIYGRRPVFFIAIPFALAFNIVAAKATNFATLAIVRFLASVFIAPAVTVAVGTINDVFDVRTEKLGTTIVVLYAAMQVWATEIGPCAGLSVVHAANSWRWSFWLSAILLGLCLVTLLGPETFYPEILRGCAKKNGDVCSRGNPWVLFRIATGRTLHMLYIEPIVWPTAIMIGLYQALIYCFYIAYPLVFERAYGFTESQVGLAFLSLFIGSVIGLVIIAVLNKRFYEPAVVQAKQEGRDVAPEKRLYAALLGAAVMPISLFWFASTAKPSFHWAVPCGSGLLMGVSLICTMLSLPVYKNDVYGAEYGASSLAADNIIRYLFSFGIPLFTVQMIDRLGFLWSINLLGFFSVVLMPIPFVIFKMGPRLRAKSRYKPVATAVAVSDKMLEPV